MKEEVKNNGIEYSKAIAQLFKNEVIKSRILKRIEKQMKLYEKVTKGATNDPDDKTRGT